MEFWEITPFELNCYFRGHAKRVKEESKEKITIAYMIAALSRAKKMPKLEKLIEMPKKKMTNEEMLNKVKILNGAFGGDVKINRRE